MRLIEAKIKMDFLIVRFTLEIRFLRSELTYATSSWQGKTIWPTQTPPLALKQYVILKASGDCTISAVHIPGKILFGMGLWIAI